MIAFYNQRGTAGQQIKEGENAVARTRLRAAIPHGHWKTTTFVAGWSAIGRLIDLITPTVCINMFAAAGYDPD